MGGKTWNVYIGKFWKVRTSRIDVLLNHLPLYTIVSRNVTFSPEISAVNLIVGSNFKSLNVSRSHSKHFEVSVSQSKKSKCLWLAKKNASLAISQSLAFTIRHPFNSTGGSFYIGKGNETNDFRIELT